MKRYPGEMTTGDEQVRADLRPHWWFFSRQIGVVLIGLVLFGFLLRLHGNLEKYALDGWGILAVIFLVWAGGVWLNWYYTHFVITTTRIIQRTGVISRHGVEIPLASITNINFNQGIWERVIGAGDLAIESAGRDGQSVFNHVRHPDAVQQLIYSTMTEAAQAHANMAGGMAAAPAPMATPAAAPAPSIPDQLAQLAHLRDTGVISADEFDAKKTELLNRM